MTTTAPAPERVYALTRIGAGDYLLPANDRVTLWRIIRYTDGPSAGLDWPRDRDVWRLCAWHRPLPADLDLRCDPDDPNEWPGVADGFDTRRDAIDDALRRGSEFPTTHRGDA